MIVSRGLLAGLATFLSVAPGDALPRNESETITTSDPFIFDMNGSSTNFLSLPTYDNSRFTLRDVQVELRFLNQRFDYRQDAPAAQVGDIFGAFVGTSTVTLGTVQPNPQQFDYRYVLHCAQGTTCNGWTDGRISFPIDDQSLFFSNEDFGRVSSVGGPGQIGTSFAYVPNLPSNSVGTLAGDVEGRYTFTWDAKNSLEYALEAFQFATDANIGPDAGAANLTRTMYQRAIALRQSEQGDEPFTNVNLNIRDVEYFARGYHGGTLASDFRQLDPSDFKNEIANAFVPVAAPVYERLKEYFGRDILRPEGAGPASEPGGAAEAIEGWVKAVNEEDLESAIRSTFPDTAVARPQAPAGANLPGPLGLLSPLESSSSEPANFEAAGVATTSAGTSGETAFRKLFEIEGPSPYFLDERESTFEMYALEGALSEQPYYFSLASRDFTAVSVFGTLIDSFRITGSGGDGWSLFDALGPTALEFGKSYDVSSLDGLLLGYSGQDAAAGSATLQLFFDQPSDLALVGLMSFDGESDGPGPISAVPLPASALLLVLGVASIGGLGRLRFAGRM